MPSTSPPPSRTARAGATALRLSVGAGAVVALVAAAGCGSSSKPAYCTDRSNLEKSIKAIPSLVASGNLSGLKTQATTIEDQAATLATSAKSDFPSESSAISSARGTLKTAVDGLPSNPSAAQLAPIALDAATLVSAVKNFASATKSKCG